jgi:glycerate dehydrogenase
VKIVVLDGRTLNPGDNPWTDLEALGEVRIFERTAPDQVQERSADAQVLVINKIRLDAALLGQLPQLRLIAITATGFDCVDVSAAAQRNILVTNVPVYGTDSVAQHVFALLLHMLHRIDIHDQAVHAGQWSEQGDFSFWKQPLTELAGKCLGVVGFGRIGRRVGELGHAFGMRVLANSPDQVDPPEYRPFEWTGLVPLVEQADVVSLNCPLTVETRGLVNRSLLSHFKPSAILINAGRGPLVVEADLADSLNAGDIAAAGLDVVSVEPITPDSPLLSARNCFITPHQAWATLEARQRLMRVSVENVKAFLQGAPRNLVNG